MSGIGVVSRLLRARRLALTWAVSWRRGWGRADAGSRAPDSEAGRAGEGLPHSVPAGRVAAR